MKYRFYGDKLQLITHTVTYESEEGHTREFIKNFIDLNTANVFLDQLEQLGITGRLDIIDNSGHEWLDEMIFSQEERTKRYVDKAIELGEESYAEWLTDNDEKLQVEEHLKQLEKRNRELEQELTETQLALVEIYELNL